jgi:hypothetical protein
MKTIFSGLLLLSAAAKLEAQTETSFAFLKRNERTQFASVVKDSIEGSEREGALDHFLAHAMISYIDQHGVTNANGYIPKQWKRWVQHQTGEIQCEEEAGGCSGGFMDMTPLWGYGCWCFFGNLDSTLGRGPPIDAYDALCKELTQCYRCIVHDADNAEDDCDPYNTSFDSSMAVSGSLGITNITTSCQTQNVENCSWRTCSCAMTMVTGFFNLAFDPNNVYDLNLKHSEGFDYNLECPQQGRASDRQCCGFYPNRRTFDRGEARDCCHERTIYNPLRHMCCDDGSHVGLGNNCE